MAERKKKKKQGRRRRTSRGRRRPRDLLFESSASAKRADRTISGPAAAERFFSASYQQPKTFSVFAGQPATQERVLLSRLFPSSSSYCYYIQHQNSISYIKVSLRKNFFEGINRKQSCQNFRNRGDSDPPKFPSLNKVVHCHSAETAQSLLELVPLSFISSGSPVLSK